MKQKVSPAVFVSVIAVILVVAVGALMWVYRAPSVAATDGGKQKPPDLKAEKHMPDSNEMQQIQEWKKTHPGAYTKY